MALNPDEARRIVREVRRQADAQELERWRAAQAKREAEYEAEAAKKSPADLIAEEWADLERPFTDGWRVGRR